MRTVCLNFTNYSMYTLYEDGRVYNQTRQVFLNGTSVTKTNRYVKIHVDKFRSLHRLVAEHFIPNPLGLPQVNHIDGDRLNNAASNLEWCSASANVLHAYAAKLKTNAGVKNPISKLTEDQVRAIRAATGTARQVRDSLGLPVGIDAVKAVRLGKNWVHVL